MHPLDNAQESSPDELDKPLPLVRSGLRRESFAVDESNRGAGGPVPSVEVAAQDDKKLAVSILFPRNLAVEEDKPRGWQRVRPQLAQETPQRLQIPARGG